MTDNSEATAHVRAFYEKHAGSYDRGARIWERLLGVDPGRRWLGAQAIGEVLEIGIGTGRSLAHYPTGVRLTAVDLSPAMLDIARVRAQDLGVDADLRIGDAQALEFRPEEFDTVLIALTLCSIPEDQLAISEAWRVLKPGGHLLLMEHVRSPNRIVRAGQEALNPLSVRFQADHLTREPLEHIEHTGFALDRVERWAWGIMERVVARKNDDH